MQNYCMRSEIGGRLRLSSARCIFGLTSQMTIQTCTAHGLSYSMLISDVGATWISSG